LLTKAFILKTPYFYWLGLISNLAILHLSLVWNHAVSNDFGFYALCWAGILWLLWHRRHIAHRDSDKFSSILGIVLLLGIFARPLILWKLDLAIFRVAPLIAILGFGLLAFGWRGLRYHWRSFLIMNLMLSSTPSFLLDLDKLFPFSRLTTVISAFFLHYIGLQATYQDVILTLPTGQVLVGYPCTGGPLIVFLLKVVLVLMIVFPLTWFKRLVLIGSVLITGFTVGCVRVSLLALVVSNQTNFDYWHGSEGGKVFLAISTFISAIFCNRLLPLEKLYSEAEQAAVSMNKSHHLQEKQWHIPLIATTWIGVILAAIYLVFFPSTGSRRLTDYTLPDTLVLSGWQRVSATALHKSANRGNPNIDIIESNKLYRYIRSNQQLEIQMRYVLNTLGNLDALTEQLTGKVPIKSFQQKVKYLQ
jgi:cyanoexosortase A